MKEKGQGGEANFWQGHSFSDACGWSVKSPFKYAAEQALAIWSSDEHNYFLPKDENLRLRNFARSGKNVPIRKFTEGSVFKLNEFPLGTIVRVSFDYQKKHLIPGLDIKREGLDLYGMVWRETNKANRENFLVCFKAKKISEGYLGLWDRVFTSDVKTGEVDHHREKIGFVSADYQFMDKVNYVEVLDFGRGVSRRVPNVVKPRVFKPMFFPGRIS